MSVRLFHPSVAHFVQQVARSLHEAGQLERFVTTVRDDPASFVQRAACAGGRLLGRDLAPQFGRRRITEVPVDLVECHPWREWLRLAAGAVDRSGRLTDVVWDRTERGFDRMVARRLSRDLAAVYGYEYSSLSTFERARDLGLKVVYDVPAPDAAYVRRLLDAEAERFPELRTAYHVHTAAREAPRLARRRAEWTRADLILVNSTFTRNSYAAAGLDCSRVHVAPLGAPPPVARDEALAGPPASAPLTLLWAGTFSVRKGAHYLLEAWRAARLGPHARLRVFGSVALPDRCLSPAPAGVEFMGSVPRTELLQHYRQADVLIFPTLCDGFGLVATEAWSRGVPVITTTRAGAADLLRPGENGRLVVAGDAAALQAELEWCATHRPELRAMRDAALATAASWQWSDYRMRHQQILTAAGILRRGPEPLRS